VDDQLPLEELSQLCDSLSVEERDEPLQRLPIAASIDDGTVIERLEECLLGLAGREMRGASGYEVRHWWMIQSFGSSSYAGSGIALTRSAWAALLACTGLAGYTAPHGGWGLGVRTGGSRSPYEALGPNT
jgi:hypothetical protein